MIAPRIRINRLYVLTNENKVAYNEHFHPGVNIIRGANSSGKSTITHLLFFALGGAYKNFVLEAKKCRDVYVELYLNETICTFCRRITCNNKGDVNDRAEMEIYWGDLEQALAKKCIMNVFGFNATQERRSFSNVIFELLNIPEIKEESNITIHQLLRLMYVDQDSPTNSLFLYEQFDSPAKREAVADLLLGSYDNELYSLIDQAKAEEDNLSQIKAMIGGLSRVFQSSEIKSTESLIQEIENREKEIVKIESEIEQLRDGSIKKTETNDVASKQKEIVKKHRDDLYNLEQTIDELDNEIVDTIYFMQALNKKKKALNESIKTRTYLDSLTLEYCPICLSKLENPVIDGHCKLCHSPIDDEKGVTRAKRMMLEIYFQIKESAKILKENKENLFKAQKAYSAKRIQCEEEKRHLDEYYKNTLPTVDEKISNLFYTKGLLHGEILQYRTMLESAEQYKQLQAEQHSLEDKIKKLNEIIQKKKTIRDEFCSGVYDLLKKNGIWLLQHDLKRESDFYSAEGFNISFADNNVYVTKTKSRYSASSNFYLKLAARLSIFFASLEKKEMRYPRFIFSDNMEDKGMETKRAQNMQRIIIEKLSKYAPDDYQIIFATSMIADEFDNANYVVGDKYTEDNKSLKNV